MIILRGIERMYGCDPTGVGLLCAKQSLGLTSICTTLGRILSGKDVIDW